MKKIFSFLVIAFFAVALAGCNGDDDTSKIKPTPTPEPGSDVTIADISGQWQLTEWTSQSEFTAGVYLEIKDDKSFVLYQNLNSQGYEKLSGSLAFGANNAISGQYADGKSWGSSYVITSFSASSMKWVTPSGNDSSVYTRKSIPEDILKQMRAQVEVATVRFL